MSPGSASSLIILFKTINMGKIKKGILGGVSGRVGSVVGGSWNGIDYVRSLPTGSNRSASALQLIQRERFRTVIRFLQPLNDIVSIGFNSYANGMSAFNAAFSWNYHNALGGDEAIGFSVDYEKARLSMGTLSPVVQPLLQASANATVALSWEDNSGLQNAQGSDTLYYVAVNPVTHETVFQLNAARRDAGSLTVSLPASWTGRTVHFLLGFVAMAPVSGSNSRKNVSETTWAGSVEVV
jgi:hypothetical protein